VRLPDGEEIVLTQYRHVTDGRTDGQTDTLRSLCENEWMNASLTVFIVRLWWVVCTHCTVRVSFVCWRRSLRCWLIKLIITTSLICLPRSFS